MIGLHWYKICFDNAMNIWQNIIYRNICCVNWIPEFQAFEYFRKQLSRRISYPSSSHVHNHYSHLFTRHVGTNKLFMPTKHEVVTACAICICICIHMQGDVYWWGLFQHICFFQNNILEYRMAIRRKIYTQTNLLLW